MFKNARTWMKLLLMLAIPIFGLVYFASLSVMHNTAQRKDMLFVKDDATLVSGITHLLQELQKERGISFGYMTIKSSKDDVEYELTKQINATDAALKKFTELVGVINAKHSTERSSILLLNFLNGLKGLDLLRQEVKNSFVGADVVFSGYTQLVHSGINLMRDIHEHLPSVKNSNVFLSIIFAAELNNFLGERRALTSSILSTKIITPENKLKLVILQEKIKLYRFEFLSFAENSILQAYQKNVEEAPVTREIDGVVQAILTQNLSSLPSKTHEEWFQLFTNQLVAVTTVINEINHNIQQSSEAFAKKSIHDIIYYNIFLLLILLLSGFLIFVVAKYILGNINYLKNAAKRISMGIVDEDLKAQTTDEFGELQKEFNKMIARTRSISELATSIAQGDYTVSVEVKSNKDLLGLSLKEMVNRLRFISDIASRISEGNFGTSIEVSNQNDVLNFSLKRMTDKLKKLNEIAEKISEGNYNQLLTISSSRDKISMTINNMIENLKKSSENAKRDFWLKAGQTKIVELISGELTVEEIASKAIIFISEYLLSQVGLFYVRTTPETLTLISSYAVNRDAVLDTEISRGSGLVGQVFLEQKTLLLDVPAGYINVQSGLGEKEPRNIILLPLVNEHEVYGVVELGSFNEFSQTEKEFLESITTHVAIYLQMAQNRKKMKQLLQQTKDQSNKLKQKTVELTQSEMTLRKQQEALLAANAELKQTTDELKQSSTELRQQQEEIIATNEELHDKNTMLESHKAELEQTTKDLIFKSKELSDASKYKTEFLVNISHELRTPLNSILILSEMMLENSEKNLLKEQIKNMEIIFKNSEQLLSIINDILDLSKVEAGKFEIIKEVTYTQELLHAIEHEIRPLAEKKHLTLAIDIQKTVPQRLYIDSQRTKQVLLNLLSNAIKFTDSGGVKVTVSKPEDFVKKTNEPLPSNEVIAFAIKDTGIGIPEDILETIFNPFQQGEGGITRKHGGTGLGLTICRKLATLMNGAIRVTSELGKGAEFTLYLPLQETPFEHETQNDTTKKLKHEKMQEKSMLVITDNPSIEKIFNRITKKYQYTIHTAHTGKEGYSVVKEYPPNGIILDLDLKDVDAIDLLEHLKNEPQLAKTHLQLVSESESTSSKMRNVWHLHESMDTHQLDIEFGIFEKLCMDDVTSVLLMEGDPTSVKEIKKLFSDQHILFDITSHGKQGTELLKKRKNFKCIILDLELTDMNGLAFLERAERELSTGLPPVIIYTSKALSEAEYLSLRKYTSKVILKEKHSPERLKKEVMLILKTTNINQQKSATVEEDKNSKTRVAKILLVDDDVNNNYSASQLLQRHGYVTVLAENGAVALKQLEQYSDISLVVMDIMMPVMDGYETIRRIRAQKHFKDIPIIALTAKTMPEEKEKCLSAGANDYLTKPIQTTKFLSMIKILLENYEYKRSRD